MTHRQLELLKKIRKILIALDAFLNVHSQSHIINELNELIADMDDSKNLK